MGNVQLPEYSVLMSVYAKDRPDWLEAAFQSMARQTCPPSEMVIVEDGPLTDALYAMLDALAAQCKIPVRRVSISVCGGLGNALHRGVLECRCKWIARMDADDIAAPDRCEAQLAAAQAHAADIVGCDCEEFIEDPEICENRRAFPETHAELVRFSRRRTPFCHSAVMMKKRAVLDAGNYHDERLLEDYDLFVRMLMNGAIGYTVKRVLFYIRVSRDFFNRRSGWTYTKRLLQFNARLLRIGWMRPTDFLMRSAGNLLVGLAPSGLREAVYKKVLRK